MKEIVTIHVGQAGNQIGFAVWELFCAEHGISRDGICREAHDNTFETFFTETSDNQYVPRSIFVDLDPSVINQMRTGSFAKLYHPSQLISSNDDSSSNFSRAFNTCGRILYNTIEKQVQRQLEACENLKCLIFFRSLGGGSGSGLTSMILEMFEGFSKTNRFEFPIHPSPHFDMSIVSPYNSLLGEHFCLDEFDVGLVIDNEALFDTCTGVMDIRQPTMTTINRILAQVCSNITAAARYKSDLYNDVTVVLTNLVPYPRIHFPLVSFAPIAEQKRVDRELHDVATLTRTVFRQENQLVKCDPTVGKYMSCSLVYRGIINASEVYRALSEIKSSSKYRFVDWCPTGFKVGIIDQPPLILEYSMLGKTDQNVVLMTNNSSVSCIWQRLAHKFHRLYSKRSFVHWYVGEGLEESEFCEALYNMATLAKDYEEVAIDTKMFDKKGLDDGITGEGENGGEKGRGSNAPKLFNTGEAGEGNAADGGSSMKNDSESSTEDDDDEEHEHFNTSNINQNFSTEIEVDDINHDDNMHTSLNAYSNLTTNKLTQKDFVYHKIPYSNIQENSTNSSNVIQVLTSNPTLYMAPNNNNSHKYKENAVNINKIPIKYANNRHNKYSDDDSEKYLKSLLYLRSILTSSTINGDTVDDVINNDNAADDGNDDDEYSSDDEASILSNLVSLTSSFEK